MPRRLVRLLLVTALAAAAVPAIEAAPTGGDRVTAAGVTLATSGEPDVTAPEVTDVATLPEPVEDGEPMTLAATITDTGGTVAGAEVAINGIESADSALFDGPVEADDGAFDEPSEELRIHLMHSPGAGSHELCVWAWDDAATPPPTPAPPSR